MDLAAVCKSIHSPYRFFVVAVHVITAVCARSTAGTSSCAASIPTDFSFVFALPSVFRCSTSKKLISLYEKNIITARRKVPRDFHRE